jgi:hypothetical protein
MKYTLCTKDEYGHPEERVIDPDTNKPTEFDDYESAQAWLVEAARKGKVDLQLGGYSIEIIDEDGAVVEEVAEDDAKQAQDDANKLIAENEDVRQAVSTLIASRQMYAVGVTELEHVISRLDEKVHPLTVDVFLQTASNTASEPFDEAVLFQGLVESVFPWMQKVCKTHTDEEIEERKKEQLADEERRKLVKVPIGVTLDKTEDPLLTKGRNVVFVGYRPAIKVLLDHITNHVLASKDDDHPQRLFTVVRLLQKARKEDGHERLVRLGEAEWKNCHATSKGWMAIVGKELVPQLPAMPDLLICDDMPAAYEGFFGAHEATRSNEALKNFGRWCKSVGSAFVGAIPMGTDAAPAFLGSQWEALKAHAVLRPVTVIREGDDLKEGQCKILVGRDAFSMVVDEDLLKSSGNIILP